MSLQNHTIEETAALLSVHPEQVRELIRTEQISWVDVSVGMAQRLGRVNPKTGRPYERRPRIRITSDEIDRFIKARTVRARKQVA